MSYSIRRIVFTCSQCDRPAKLIYPERDFHVLSDLISLSCDNSCCSFFGFTVEGDVARRAYVKEVPSNPVEGIIGTAKTLSKSSKELSDLFPFRIDIIFK